MTDPREKWFPQTIGDPPDRVFELGLVLGGTVSAGAYTAGALDLLLEALESWHDGAEPHKVSIKVAGGSSGGAVCAATLGVLSNRPCAHARDTNFNAFEANPLWKLWVETFDLERMLATDDLHPPLDADAGSGVTPGTVQHVPSLLNCRVIDEGAAGIVAFAEAAPLKDRPYFAAPFRVVVTVANMRGIPFKLDVPKFSDFAGSAYRQHDDHAWFAFPNGAAAGEKRPDEFWLQTQAGAAADVVGYAVLASYAVASGAMPLGLAARPLARPREHYRYRPAVFAGAAGPRLTWPEPDWAELPEDGPSYGFTAVDGGTLNNDPVRLVHVALSGLVGHNDQTPEGAKRAMLMIDPLADQPPVLPLTGTSLVAVAGGIVPTFVQGARYLTADMELFGKETVYSRFQLVPFRPDTAKNGPILIGEPALAGTSLAALAGFSSRAVRMHDYLLGRHNMREYLDREMVLRGDNPLFEKWTEDQRADRARDADGIGLPNVGARPHETYFLPVLPVAPEIQTTLPGWPAGALAPGEFADLIESRVHAVLSQVVNDNIHGLLNWLVDGLAVPAIASYVAGAAVKGWRQALQPTGLLKPGT